MKQLVEKLKKIPAWGWAVIVAAVGALSLFVLRRGGSQVMISPPEQPQYEGPVPSPGAGASPSPVIDMSPLLGAIGQLGKQMAETNQGLAQLGQQQAASTALLTRQQATAADYLVGVLGNRPAQTPVEQGAQQAVTIQTVNLSTWVDDGANSGYITQQVQVNTASSSYQYEQGILDAKSRYLAAEAAGNSAAMDAAHAEAQRWRTKAAKDGVSLGNWATDGADNYEQRSSSSTSSGASSRIKAV